MNKALIEVKKCLNNNADETIRFIKDINDKTEANESTQNI